MPHIRPASPKDEDRTPRKPLTRRQFLSRVAVGAVALTALDVGARADERDWLQITHTDVPIAGWPRSLDRYTIGLMADFHCHGDQSHARVVRAARMLLGEKPDVVVLAGDFVTSGHMKWMEMCADALSPLVGVPGGAFAVLGNHDWWCLRPDEVVHHLRRVGIRLLRNETVAVKGIDLSFTGVDDVWMGAEDLALAMKHAPPTGHRILIVHEPDYADVAGPGFALQLSGHSHGGQIRIPGLPAIHTPHLARRYVEGLEQSATHPLYTTRGVGTTGIPVRFHCPPEISLIHLRAA